jgi:hypothetical protein
MIGGTLHVARDASRRRPNPVGAPGAPFAF